MELESLRSLASQQDAFIQEQQMRIVKLSHQLNSQAKPSSEIPTSTDGIHARFQSLVASKQRKKHHVLLERGRLASEVSNPLKTLSNFHKGQELIPPDDLSEKESAFIRHL